MSDSPASATKDLVTLAVVLFFVVLIAAFVDRTVMQPITDEFVGRIKV
jgi:hypothetical protein